MLKWQAKMVDVYEDIDEPQDADDLAKDECLRQGRDGWELASATEYSEHKSNRIGDRTRLYRGWKLWFKRAMEEA